MIRNFFKLALIVSCVLTCNFAFARIEFATPISKDAAKMWTTSNSPLKCILSYSFTDIGSADFVTYAGRDLNKTGLFLNFKLGVLRNTKMRVIANRPEWQSGNQEEFLGEVKMYKGFAPFIGPSLTWEILTNLNRGRQILLPFEGLRSINSQLIIPVISPLGFKAKMRDFQNCTSKLLRVNFNDLKLLPLIFEYQSTEFDKQTKSYLDNLILYVKADNSVNKIEIKAFSEDMDSKQGNLDLASKRVDYVAKYLEDNGIDKKIIVKKELNPLTLSKDSSYVRERRDIQFRKGLVTLGRNQDLVDPNLELDAFPDVGNPNFKLDY